MSGNYLLDTNIVLGFLKGTPSVVQCVDNVADGKLYVSVISRMELLSFHGITETEMALIHEFLSSMTLVPLNKDVEDVAIRLRRETRRRLPEDFVAASAIVTGAVLVTCDRELAATDFPGLTTYNPDTGCL